MEEVPFLYSNSHSVSPLPGDRSMVTLVLLMSVNQATGGTQVTLLHEVKRILLRAVAPVPATNMLYGLKLSTEASEVVFT